MFLLGALICEISTHALREEGDGPYPGVQRVQSRISTHALREEGDESRVGKYDKEVIFLPTPSARRATAA